MYKMAFRRGAVIAVSSALLAVGTVIVAQAQSPDGCDMAVGPIHESSQFTPYDARFSHLPDIPLTSEGQPVQPSGRKMDGLELRWTAGDGERSLYEYFFQRDLDGNITVPAFLTAGGIQLDTDVVDDGEPYTADDVIAQVGDRAVRVQIGDYEGALVWADPESNGARPHHLYWSDGISNYALIAVRGPQRMVQLGRGLMCGE